MTNLKINHKTIDGVSCEIKYTPTERLQREYKFADGIIIQEFAGGEWYCNDMQNYKHLEECKKHSSNTWNALLNSFEFYPEFEAIKKQIDTIENHLSILENDYNFKNGIDYPGIITVYEHIVKLQKIASKHWILMCYIGCVDVHLFFN